ncbi:MAG: transposase family protein [Deltaproteobacteria bacterium]|nr:transposase family protein [Deltaproteobacteria bacterium]
MNKSSKNMEIATFRFGVIADFVVGQSLSYGLRSKLIKNKASKKYLIPHSENTRISESTIKKWVLDYRRAGNRIEGLMPQDRKDKGVYKSLDLSIQMAIKEIKKEKPDLTGVALVEELKHRKYIGVTESLNLSVLYRFLKEHNLKRPSRFNIDRRAFEVSAPNEMWQSDIMHGPYIKVGNKKKKTYLIAILDDHSRLITHAEFYFSEKLIDFKDALKKAIETRGLPQKLYIDNGSCYRALNVEQIAAILGIGIIHTPPYVPQGRGKIERWFRYVRESFLVKHDSFNSLEEINESFSDWLCDYQKKIHSTTKQTPLARYKQNMKCVRPAPRNLIDYFRLIKFRTVRKERTIQLNGNFYEVSVELIDLKVEARYHQEDPDDIEIYFDNKSYGKAALLNRQVNSRIGRDTKSKEIKIISGELFK